MHVTPISFSQAVFSTDPSAPPESLANKSAPQSPRLPPQPTDLAADWVLLDENDLDKAS